MITGHLPTFRLSACFGVFPVDRVPIPRYLRLISYMRRLAVLALVATVMLLGPLSGPVLAAHPSGAASPSLIPIPNQPAKPFTALSRAILAGRDSPVPLSPPQGGPRHPPRGPPPRPPLP